LGTSNHQRSYLPRVGLYFGILGTISLLFFVLIFQEDWMHRYSYMIALVPIPIIFLFIARKKPLVGGLLLVALGVVILILDIIFSAGHPGQIAGRGLGYTIVFVSLPLIVSGVLFILYRINTLIDSRPGKRAWLENSQGR